MNGELVNSQWGYAKERSFHSDKMSSCEYFDQNDQPVASPDSLWGVAKTDMIKDPKTGNICEIRHYGTDGKPMNNKDGICVFKMEIITQPDGETITRHAHYDANGNLSKLGNSTHAVIEVMRNSKGEMTGGRYLDETNSPCEIFVDFFRCSSWKIRKGLKIFNWQITEDSVTTYDFHGNPIETLPKEDFSLIDYL